MEEFEADNGKLLKEEMDFAAEETVSDFIKHFKGKSKNNVRNMAFCKAFQTLQGAFNQSKRRICDYSV